MARCLRRDPLAGAPAAPLSLNRYSYALNNPVTRTDPSGLVAGDPNSAYPPGSGIPDGTGNAGGPGKSKVLQPPNCLDPSTNCGGAAPSICLPFVGCLAVGGIIKEPGKRGDGSEGDRPSGRLRGPQPVRPADLGGYPNLRALGEALNWGSQEDSVQAAERGSQVTAEQVFQLGVPPGSVTADTVRAWRDFYAAVAYWDSGNPTAPGRASYLGAVLQNLGGQ